MAFCGLSAFFLAGGFPMGLDLVQFILAVEDAFELEIPDPVAATLTTPRRLIDYLATQLPMRDGAVCLTQHTFYRLRELARAELGLSRHVIRPTTPLAPLFPAGERSPEWNALRTRLGARHWPRIGRRRFFERPLSPHVDNFAKLTQFCVARVPVAGKAPGERWTRAEIAHVVDALMREELAVTRYTEDSRFVEDLRLD
jgi:hypothetical protein